MRSKRTTVDPVVPDWIRSLRARLDANVPTWFAEHPVPPNPQRSSAVMVLFYDDADGQTRVILTERAHSLRSHAAQVAFPGGHVDPGETVTEAALRESNEEIGLNPDTAEVIDRLPGVYLTPQRTALVPVLGWWHDPHPIHAVDAQEVNRVLHPTVAELVDPRNRHTATVPGYQSPAFCVDDLIVWGLTSFLLDAVLTLGGFTVPWAEDDLRPLPERLLAAYPRAAEDARRS